MSLPTLPPLREVIARHGLNAKKSLGQNFLTDTNLLDRIARIPGLGPVSRVYEVGPGPGGLTRALLRTGAQVFAVERDDRALPALAELAAAADGRLTVIGGDAMAVDPRAHLAVEHAVPAEQHRLRERLAMETKHLQRKLSRVTKESEQKMADERAALESRLQETERRSEARLRAERTRLAVRYGNQGKQVVQEKLTEKLESLGYNGDGGASPALSSRRSLSPGR
jgi:SAM-dependent methyltransferase